MSPGRTWLLLNMVAIVLLVAFFTVANVFKPCTMPAYASLPPHPAWLSVGVAFILLGIAMRKAGSQYLAYYREELGKFYASERFRVRQTYIMSTYIGCLCIALSFGVYYGFIASLAIIPLIIATLFYEVASRLARRD
jgi:hypothetical protein